MKSKKTFIKKYQRKNTQNRTKNYFNINKIILNILITLSVIIITLIISFRTIKNKSKGINFFNKRLNKAETGPANNICMIAKNQLENRTHPFDYESEFNFFISLISCKIPFSFIRFADGEEFIMRGKYINCRRDKWYWTPENKNFRESLIESSSICTNPNNFIAIPCKNWIHFSKSILSFSKCTSAKYMTFATVFANKNYQAFKDWLINFLNDSNRWKIILVANTVLNTNISWAYKYFPIPDHLIENWDKYSSNLLQNLSEEAKRNELIFFVSAGPAADVIISYLTKINNKNIYIDFGSSIEFVTKGYSTRSYSDKKSVFAHQRCEPFYLKDNQLVYED